MKVRLKEQLWLCNIEGLSHEASECEPFLMGGKDPLQSKIKTLIKLIKQQNDRIGEFLEKLHWQQ